MEENEEICASMVLNHEQAPEYSNVQWRYVAEEEQVLVIHTLCIPPHKSGNGYGHKMVEFAKKLYQNNGFQIAGYGRILLQGLIDEEQVYLECLL